MTALRDEIRAIIAQDGPISVERFMGLALAHPKRGYYMTRDPFGAAGDFTTAPEISQMFGELLGLWAAEVWHGLGRPKPIHLVELGPGRGTLMADAMRAARALPPFLDALDIHFVETSPMLRAAQEATLARSGVAAIWHTSTATLPAGPAIILANEFFDALPIRQYQRTSRGWCERLVGLGDGDGLVFGLAPEPEPAVTLAASESAVFELAATGLSMMGALATRLRETGGALLAIDYGHALSGFADTLQAMHAHRFVHPLATPGEADLTAHVDFAALARVASAAGLAVHGPVPQGAFLRSLGIGERAAALRRRAGPEQGIAIDQALARLCDPEPGMGTLFKVLAVVAPGGPLPPGFPQGDTTS